MVESSDNVSARNRVSTASGKYQFMRVWDPWFKRTCGRTWSSSVPKRSASKEVKRRAALDQEDMFDAYYQIRVLPWIQWVRKTGIGKKYSDFELLAIYHRQGEYEAERFIRYGRDPNAGTHGNKHLKVYLTSVRKFYSAYRRIRTAMTAALKGRMLSGIELGDERETDARDL